MKNTTILLLFITGLFVSCRQHLPPIGTYKGVFTYDNPNFYSVELNYMKITESSKGKIIINDSELKKDGTKIEGLIKGNERYEIKGECSHKFLSKEYEIKGDFKQLVTSHFGDVVHTGTFVIKTQ